MSEYKNVKITPEVYEMLKRGKDDGQSWSHYLKEQRERALEREEIRDGRL